jgi:hypothetical protein
MQAAVPVSFPPATGRVLAHFRNAGGTGHALAFALRAYMLSLHYWGVRTRPDQASSVHGTVLSPSSQYFKVWIRRYQFSRGGFERELLLIFCFGRVSASRFFLFVCWR